jgi:predicted Zn finger-like uncharacterized protein
MFRVVPDQLKISDGWVRCGHCADVFDATLYLEPWVPPPPSSPSAQPPSAPEHGAGSTGAPVAPVGETVFVSPGAPESFRSDTAPGPATEPEPDPEPEALSMPAVDIPAEEPASEVTETAVVASTLESQDDPESDFEAELRRFAQRSAPVAPELPDAQAPESPASERPAPEPEALEPEAPVDVTDEPDTVEPGFVRQARRKAFWQSPLMRGLMSLFVLVLTALLAAQWALHERDRLVAAQPGLRPLLSQACGLLGCELAPLRRIEAVVIDSSTLSRRLGSFYAFDFVLRNNADLPLAVPALELSLTDNRDEVLSRRVFLPSDLPGAPAELPARGSVSLSLRLSIAVDGNLPMAGYRALVFYP